jgi:hypothetical protein
MSAKSVCLSASDAGQAAKEMVAALSGGDPAAVVYFASPRLDGRRLARELRAAFPRAAVLGCSTAGEFSQQAHTVGGVSAVALDRAQVKRAYTALASLEGGVEAGVRAAAAELEKAVEAPLSSLDPERWVGLVLIDGLHGAEERVNEVLGEIAPFLYFVGGSAGDDLGFKESVVYAGERGSTRGAALALLEMAAPWTVMKTCSFVPAGRRFHITAADVERRVVLELDGRPAALVYAEAVGCAPDKLDSAVFMEKPLGLMIDGKPWIRSPQAVVEGGGIAFYCQILPGTEVELMASTDLIAETAGAFAAAAEKVGGAARAVVAFNCILRRLQLDARHGHEAFVRVFGDAATAGFHTYGESWMGHINQTLTALVVG